MARVWIERELLDEAWPITGSRSDLEVRVLALETLIAVHRTRAKPSDRQAASDSVIATAGVREHQFSASYAGEQGYYGSVSIGPSCDGRERPGVSARHPLCQCQVGVVPEGCWGRVVAASRSIRVPSRSTRADDPAVLNRRQRDDRAVERAHLADESIAFSPRHGASVSGTSVFQFRTTE